MMLSVMWTEYNYVKLAVMLLLILVLRKGLVLPWRNQRPAGEVENGVEKLHYVTEYRSMMLLATAVSILAVDFQAYPRRFVKSETYGISLMDLGTGSVLFASALVSRQARKPESAPSRLRGAVLSCLPLLVLGLLRFSIHKFVNYQEHVSEYGVHWNFFLSLATVVILSAIVQPSPVGAFVFSALLMWRYQQYLNNGLSDFILTADRTDFFSQNREGILGCCGFLAIYQMGLALRPLVTDSTKCLRNTLVLWGVFAGVLWVVPGEPSRRLNNMNYTLCVLAHNCFVLFLFCLSERMQTVYSPSLLVKAINFNQLPYFMLSNLLTGAVNLLVRTLYASDLTAFALVLSYQAVAIGAMVVLYLLRIRLKYW